MADNVTLTPEERIQELSDSILASVIRQDDMAKKNRQMLFGQLSPKAFRDENFVIYSVLYSFKEKGIVPDVDFLKLYLMRNTKLIRGNSSNLDMNAYADSSQDPVTGYIAAVVNQFVRLGGMEGCDGDSFQLLLEKYKSEYSAFEMSKSLSDAKMILYDGMQVGNKTYQGYADSVAYVKGRASMLEGLFDRSTGEGFIDSRLEAIEDKEDKKPELIGDFDMIRPLNKILGGIYTSLFYSVLAPTKGGKSKFCARLAHTIAGTTCQCGRMKEGMPLGGHSFVPYITSTCICVANCRKRGQWRYHSRIFCITGIRQMMLRALSRLRGWICSQTHPMGYFI